MAFLCCYTVSCLCSGAQMWPEPVFIGSDQWDCSFGIWHLSHEKGSGSNGTQFFIINKMKDWYVLAVIERHLILWWHLSLSCNVHLFYYIVMEYRLSWSFGLVVFSPSLSPLSLVPSPPASHGSVSKQTLPRGLDCLVPAVFSLLSDWKS